MLLLDQPLKVICNCAADDKGIDWLGMLSAVVALLAFLVSVRANAQSKRIELKTKRFERLVFQPVESSLSALDALFKQHGSAPATQVLQSISELVTNVNLLLTRRVKQVYPNFSHGPTLEAASDGFTDNVYAHAGENLSIFLGEYESWKMLLLNTLYSFMDHELEDWWDRNMREVNKDIS